MAIFLFEPRKLTMYQPCFLIILGINSPVDKVFIPFCVDDQKELACEAYGIQRESFHLHIIKYLQAIHKPLGSCSMTSLLISTFLLEYFMFITVTEEKVMTNSIKLTYCISDKPLVYFY